jgi:hypothetical protein
MRCSMMIGVVVGFFVLMVGLPVLGMMVGIEPWVVLLCGLLLVLSGVFAGVALFGFGGSGSEVGAETGGESGKVV